METVPRQALNSTRSNVQDTLEQLQNLRRENKRKEEYVHVHFNRYMHKYFSCKSTCIIYVIYIYMYITSPVHNIHRADY